MAFETINQVKKKLEGDVQTEEINIQRYNQELQNLDTRFKVGEITAENLQKAEQRIQRIMQRSLALVEELRRLRASQSSADVGGYIDTKTGGRAGGAPLAGSLTFSTVSAPRMDNIRSAIQGTSITDFSEFRTDLNEILSSPLELIGPTGGLILFISIFLPWISATIFSQSLTDLAGLSSGIGLLVLIEVIAAIMGIGSIFLVWENARGIILTAIGAITLVMAVILIPALFDSYVGSGIFSSVVGIGYYVNIIGSIIMLAGGVMALGK